MLRSVLLRASRSRFLRSRATRYGFTRRAVRRFMPGEDLDAALEASERLAERGLAVLLTELGEDVEDALEAGRVRDHYVDVLERLHGSGLDAEISVKPTQLGVDQGLEACYRHLRAIAERAEVLDAFLWIDMESSAHTDATLELFRRLRTDYENVGVCLQAYLYRTAADLEALLPLRPAIRLVKGAYREPRDIAFQSKREVYVSYVGLAERLLELTARGHVPRPCWGTHDLRLIERVAMLADAKGVRRDAYEVQMLYGIRTAEQERLAREGYRVRVLISYGEAWYPWFVRRLAERPANLLFVGRNLFG